MTKQIFSMEVFPPKKSMGIETVYNTLNELKDLKPDFISVTYGAGGSANSGNTLAIADYISGTCGVESVVHLPCLYLTRERSREMLTLFKQSGVRNILALRGDAVEGAAPVGEFAHASDLIRFIKEFDDEWVRTGGAAGAFGNAGACGRFEIYAACYPELHPESRSVMDDIAALKEKEDAGATHFLSQLFFDNEKFYRFVERARLAGVKSPLEAGIMPATNRKSIERMVNLTNAVLPEKFTRMMKKYEEKPDAIRDAGIAYAIDQICDLVTNDVDGVHLYTMNNALVARRIFDACRSMFA